MIIHIFLAFFLMMIFVLTDFIYKLKYKNYIEFRRKTVKDMIVIFILNIFILSFPSFFIQFISFEICLFFIFIQQFHYAFFRSYLMPYEIVLFFLEGEEIVDTLKNTVKYMVLPIFIFLISSLLIYFILKIFHSSLIFNEYSGYFVLILLLFGSLKIGLSKGSRHLPQSYFTSIRNTYYSLSKFLFKEMPNLFKKSNKKFKSYSIKKTENIAPNTIIIIMGESLSSKRMSLFGYQFKTTPNLEKLKDSKNFLYKCGFSAATVTKTSMVDFINIRREPENMEPIVSQKANLFKLAKEQGYKTHYITTQKINILGNYIGYCDIVKSDKDFEVNGRLYDEKLVEYLKGIDFKQKNFIFLHQRNSHSPYEETTPEDFRKYDYNHKDFHRYMLNSYMNSLLYTDFLFNEIFRIVDNLDKEAVVFITSDHGEMLGFEDENGKYGHTVLDLEVAKIPLLVYKNALLKDKMNINSIINHYQYAKYIAEVLGFEIYNPNEGEEFYLNGTDILGRHGYLKYTKKDFDEKYSGNCN